MIYIEINKGTNEITRQNYAPFEPINGTHMTKEEMELAGYLIESIPDSDNMPGKSSVLKFNPTTRTIYYDFVDIPKSQEEILQGTIAALGQTVAEEKIKSMQKDTLISSLGQELTKVKLEIMQLKGGV